MKHRILTLLLPLLIPIWGTAQNTPPYTFIVTDTHHGNDMYYNVLSESDKTVDLVMVKPASDSPTVVVIPSTVISPDDNMTYHVKTIRNARIKNARAYYVLPGVESIGGDAFAITDVTRAIYIGEGPKYIDEYAFYNVYTDNKIEVELFLPSTMEPVGLLLRRSMIRKIHFNDWAGYSKFALHLEPYGPFQSPSQWPPIECSFGMGPETSFFYDSTGYGIGMVPNGGEVKPLKGCERIVIADDVTSVDVINHSFGRDYPLCEPGKGTVVFGKSLESIEGFPINGCFPKEIYCRNPKAAIMPENLDFLDGSYEETMLYIPKGSRADYDAKGWGKFKHITEYEVKDYVMPTGVKLSTATPGIEPDIRSGTVMNFTAEIIPANADFADIQAWWVDDPSAFRIIENGAVKGIANYETETMLHVSTINGHQDSMTIRIDPDPDYTGIDSADDIANDGVSVIGDGSLRAVATGVPDGTVYCLADMSGRIITSGTGDGFDIQLQVPSQGIYLFRYGTKTIKTVIR